MTNLQIFDFSPLSVRTVMLDGEVWFVAKDVCNVLGLANSRQALSGLDDEDKKGVSIDNTLGGKQTMNAINELGIKKLVSKSRKPQARELAQYLGFECYFSPLEADCIRIIESAFQHLNPIQQFQVSGYRIDLYFPKEKIAVECDEHGHSNYNEKKEIERQDQIIKLLGCKFIRFNPNEHNFNIGDVINKIMLALSV